MRTHLFALGLGSVVCFCLISTSTGEAQEPDDGYAGRGDFVGLIADPKVQAQLNLSGDQALKLKSISDAYRSSLRDVYADYDRNRGSKADATRLQAVAKEKASADQQIKEVLSAVQFSLLQRIRYQRLGGASLFLPEVAKLLGITPEQEKDLLAARQKNAEAFQQMQEDIKRDRRTKAAYEKLQEDYHTTASARLLRVLSAVPPGI